MSASWAKLPWELRARPQWCLAAPAGLYSAKGKEPLSFDENGKLAFASTVIPGTWLSFEKAATEAHARGWHIGYMLSEDDPYACIDFDIKDAENAPDKPETHTTREQYEWYLQCIYRFDSYTEHSASRKGFHVWVRGKIGAGVRSNGVEVYSQERFMICTGYVTNDKPIEEREGIIQSFAAMVRPKKLGDGIVLEELPETVDDWYVLETATRASNADKFCRLWEGKWSELGYPSQSEADLALLSMFTFYSPSNEQVRRCFRLSGLGQREKAVKNNDYLNRTLRIIRGREKAESSADISAVVKSAELVAQLEKERLAKEAVAQIQGATPVEIKPLHVPNQNVPEPLIPNTAAQLAIAAPVPANIVAAGELGIAWPPGVAGRIAHFVYQSAPRPVKEVAVVSAIGILAGICGKAWHIPQSGLNMYVTLIARSAIGKEAMHSGISALVRAVTEKLPIFHNFVSFDDFASGPALTKACTLNPSFVNVSGEWGHKLRRMAEADSGRDQAMQTLRQVMTNLYQKSGPAAMVGGIRYSQADNNIASVSGVSYSMIGETTPSTFYAALTESMMEDGFLSRFLAIEYTGDRPPANRNQILIPDAGLVEVLSAMGMAAQRVTTSTQPSMLVNRTEEAALIMERFEKECDDKINSTDTESYRQMWNRASLKAMRLSALLAVADHYLHPIINAEHIGWAIDVVRRDIKIMHGRIETGDVGSSDMTRERKMHSIIRNYMEKDLTESQADAQKLKKFGIIPRKYLQIYCSQSVAFTKYRGGATQALNLTLQSLIDSGYLAEVDKATAVGTYGFHGKCYRVLSLARGFYEETKK